MDTNEELVHRHFVFAKSPIKSQAQREKKSIFCLDAFHAGVEHLMITPITSLLPLYSTIHQELFLRCNARHLHK